MRSAILQVVMLASLANVVAAQVMPVTIAEAEAEGSRFAHADSAASSQSLFTGAPFGGTADRRCVHTLRGQSIPGGSLRSGDFIVRGGFSGSFGLQAGTDHKVLWIPFHGAALHGTPLVVRAVRIGHPEDSVRFSREGLARGHEVTGETYGYPSIVTFPKAGEWLVVATAKDDWACFVLDVAEAN
jgi:hypothetical protein